MTGTPTPLVIPEGTTLTTMGEARKIDSGQVCDHLDRWSSIGDHTFWRDDAIVLWRPASPRKIMVELDEADVRHAVEHGGTPIACGTSEWEDAVESGKRIQAACRVALDRLDIDQ